MDENDAAAADAAAAAVDDGDDVDKVDDADAAEEAEDEMLIEEKVRSKPERSLLVAACDDCVHGGVAASAARQAST